MPPQTPGSLVVIVDGRPLEFHQGDRVLIGRGPDCQVVLDDNRVSRHHAQISFEQGGWTLRDLGSTNGTFVGPTRVVRLGVMEPSAVRFGNANSGPMIVVQPPSADTTNLGTPQQHFDAPHLREPNSTHTVATRVRMGRAPDNDLVLGDLLVSRYHSEVRRTPNGFEVIDLGSRNGTYLNGQRVSQAPFNPGDLLSVGHHQFVLHDDRLIEYVDQGRISLTAEDLSVTVDGGKVILDRVGFTLDECSLLGVVGPSGSGKSTMLRALTGESPAQAGRVVYEGRDLYDNYEDLRHRIGLVPQDDILHRGLTVKRALEYAAALRFPDDVSRAEREQRIVETCASLGLTDQFNQRISALSGGQRKRVSVALELLTQPSLLFLDEPTSGLDPGLDQQVMTELRRLSDEGRTVIVVTHSVQNLDLCDRVLLLAPGGKTAYFGPPGQPLLDHFGVSEYPTIFQMVTYEPDRWQHAFWQSSLYQQYCAPESHNAIERRAGAAGPSAAPRQQNIFKQFWVLSRRMVSVMVADKPYAAFIFGLPFVLAALAHAIPGENGLMRPPDLITRVEQEAQQLLVVLIIGAIFLGTSTAIRELVGEVAIYRRERSVGLSPGAYMFSKLFVFGVINVAQAFVLVLLGLLGRRYPQDPLVLPFSWLEIVVAIALLTLTSTALGLLISSRVSSNEQIMPILVLVIMTQVVLCGGLVKVVDRPGLEQVAWLTPARWGYAAAAATVDLRNSMLLDNKDEFWIHAPLTWLFVIGILLAQLIAMVMLTRLMLFFNEPSRRSRKNQPVAPTSTGAAGPQPPMPGTGLPYAPVARHPDHGLPPPSW